MLNVVAGPGVSLDPPVALVSVMVSPVLPSVLIPPVALVSVMIWSWLSWKVSWPDSTLPPVLLSVSILSVAFVPVLISPR